VFGPECLSEVLDQGPSSYEPRPIVHERGDLVAMTGFGIVLALSVLPWSRFGDASGPLEAWTVHWSLLAVTTALGGLTLTIAFRTRPRSPRLEVGVYVALAVIVGVAAYMHRRHPPSLSSPSVVPLLAMGAALVVLVGAALKASEILRARWPRRDGAQP
jgi:peptidoglycan/LPS O-acetylase OafA/YrhL